MRVMVACPTLGISSEVWILRQIEGFAQLGHDLSVLCWRQPGYTPQEFTDKPVEVLPFELPLIKGLHRWCQRAKHALDRNFIRGSSAEEAALAAVLERDRPDVILCHFGNVSMRLLPVARKMGIPVVAHFHGADLSSKLSDRWYRWTLASQAKRFDHVVVVGSHQAKLVESLGVHSDRLSLIPCGVPTDQFNPQPRPPRDTVGFIQVSRIVPWKGIEQALRAFQQVHAKQPNTRLTFIGEGEQIEAMQELAETLGISGAVTFTGALPPARVVESLQESDVFLHHSLTHHTGWCEGFGVSIAEAAAMAMPLVVTNSGGIPDQVIDQQTGFLVEERDVSGMAKAMLALAEQPELRERIGQAGRKRMVQHFDSAGQVAKLERVLRQASNQSEEDASLGSTPGALEPVGVKS